MNLARIPFINTAPYFHFLSQRWLDGHRLSLGSPRQLGSLAKAGKLDAGVFSLVDGLELVESGEFEWLGRLGIAGFGPIRSILLTGASDLGLLEGQAVAVTPQTATSVRLLEVLARQKAGVKGLRLEEGGQAALQLLIGDEALRWRAQGGPQAPAVDLCEQWSAWTGLPFVFARWAVRKALPEKAKRELELSLRSAVDLALDDLEIVAGRESERTGLPAAGIEEYLKGVRYMIGPEEQKGAEEFKRRLSSL